MEQDKETMILLKVNAITIEAKTALDWLEKANTEGKQLDGLNAALIAKWSSELVEAAQKINKIVAEQIKAGSV